MQQWMVVPARGSQWMSRARRTLAVLGMATFAICGYVPAVPAAGSAGTYGGKIAFRSNRDGNYEIYVMNANGSNPTRLTNNPAVDANPEFNQDGSKIAFISNR